MQYVTKQQIFVILLINILYGTVFAQSLNFNSFGSSGSGSQPNNTITDNSNANFGVQNTIDTLPSYSLNCVEERRIWENAHVERLMQQFNLSDARANRDAAATALAICQNLNFSSCRTEESNLRIAENELNQAQTDLDFAEETFRLASEDFYKCQMLYGL